MSDTYDPAENCDPCPFCQKPAGIFRNGNENKSGKAWSIQHNQEGCPISVYGFYTPSYPTREAAVMAWNTRKTVVIPVCALNDGEVCANNYSEIVFTENESHYDGSEE